MNTHDATELSFRDVHGVEIFFRRWSCRRPRGVVIVAHGASEHSGRYDRFARALADAGITTYAPDHRGHGRTAASTGVGRLGPGGGDGVVDDVDALVLLAREQHPGLPAALFGHSMGSLIALGCATAHPADVQGLLLCGFPAAAAGVAAFAEQLHQASAAGLDDAPAPSLAGLNEAFEPARTPFDWLSRDEAEVDRYLADPFCGDQHPLTFGYLAGLFDVAVPALQADALAKIGCPVLLIAGTRDPAAAFGANVDELESAMREAGVAVTSRLYPNARHELLNETNRDEVTADIIAWLDAHVLQMTSDS